MPKTSTKAAYLACLKDIEALCYLVQAGSIEERHYRKSDGTTVTYYYEKGKGIVKNPTPEQKAEAKANNEKQVFDDYAIDKFSLDKDKNVSYSKELPPIAQGEGVLTKRDRSNRMEVNKATSFAWSKDAINALQKGDLKVAMQSIGKDIKEIFDVVKDPEAKALAMAMLDDEVASIIQDKTKSAEQRMTEIQQSIKKAQKGINDKWGATKETARLVKDFVTASPEKKQAMIKKAVQSPEFRKAQAEMAKWADGHPKVTKAVNQAADLLNEFGHFVDDTGRNANDIKEEVSKQFKTGMANAGKIIKNVKETTPKKIMESVKDELDLDMAVAKKAKIGFYTGASIAGAAIGTGLMTAARSMAMGIPPSPPLMAFSFVCGTTVALASSQGVQDFGKIREKEKELERTWRREYEDFLLLNYPEIDKAGVEKILNQLIKDMRKDAGESMNATSLPVQKAMIEIQRQKGQAMQRTKDNSKLDQEVKASAFNYYDWLFSS